MLRNSLVDLYEKDLISLPNCVLFPHQRKAYTEFNKILKQYRTSGLKLMILEWHRRCGKDILLLQILVKEAVQHTGNYLYIFPQVNQARQAIFNGIDTDGRRLLDYIPYQLIHKIKEQEMLIYLKTGQTNSRGEMTYSTIQFTGSDHDSKVGGSVKGAVFSEFALTNPKIYMYLEPALAKNKGWAGFVSTPRGEQNFMVDLINNNKNNPRAFIWEQMTIEDSYDFAGKHIFTKEEYDDKIKGGLPLETARQELTK
ncbi:MAG: hypothetical protein ACRCYT_05390 [Cetobacterium sp.]